ncbi:hypothetical protein FIBSPDRAFT_934076 [Athelia psychrophila]|uniref:Uncharacterized protein n=1 Tax=Athelia psychrophila TaxID=1759441 RepID=A0A166G227_9AGAM|nr:hypothetical protein FIBSPDRAFT_934076 [Fibularhizoctonia sp. CBS 109695]
MFGIFLMAFVTGLAGGGVRVEVAALGMGAGVGEKAEGTSSFVLRAAGSEVLADKGDAGVGAFAGTCGLRNQMSYRPLMTGIRVRGTEARCWDLGTGSEFAAGCSGDITCDGGFGGELNLSAGRESAGLGDTAGGMDNCFGIGRAVPG